MRKKHHASFDRQKKSGLVDFAKDKSEKSEMGLMMMICYSQKIVMSSRFHQCLCVQWAIG